MPAIKHGYSKAHDEHYQWLWVPALDCHIRLTCFKGWNLAWVFGVKGVLLQAYKVWAIDCYIRGQAFGDVFWGQNSTRRMARINRSKIELGSEILEGFNGGVMRIVHSGRNNYMFLKRVGVQLCVHRYRGGSRGLCFIYGVSKNNDKAYCVFKLSVGDKATSVLIVEKNLIPLHIIFEGLGFDVEMRWNWFNLALNGNMALAMEMIEEYFK
jgi:hypothetical protein